MVRDLNPDFRINPDSDPDVFRIVAKMLWIHYLVSVSHFLSSVVKGKVKCKGLETSYSTVYMSQTRDQQRCTISEVAADWHEPMVPQRIMWPYSARANGQLGPRCS